MHRHRGRFYVLGATGERYTIRVTNPTSRRVEAVVSVDGLDVIDGRPADVSKRGYVVPAHGELRVEGFRTSTSEVATFRFSSVTESYAGRKGKARNVGVIGVAIFEEQAPPEIIVRGPVVTEDEDDGWDGVTTGDWGGAEGGAVGGSVSGSGRGRGASGRAEKSRADAPRSPARDAEAPEAEPAPRVTRSKRPAPPPSTRPADLDLSDDAPRGERCCGARPQPRPGLGTEFGEQRRSTVSWTQFVRANATQPTAMAELRYNDAEGLRALGIQLQQVTPDELHTRETAEPFPGGRGFAQPPR